MNHQVDYSIKINFNEHLLQKIDWNRVFNPVKKKIAKTKFQNSITRKLAKTPKTSLRLLILIKMEKIDENQIEFDSLNTPTSSVSSDDDKEHHRSSLTSLSSESDASTASTAMECKFEFLQVKICF